MSNFAVNPPPGPGSPQSFKPITHWYKPVKRYAAVICFALLFILFLDYLIFPIFKDMIRLVMEKLEVKSPEALSAIDILIDFICYTFMFCTSIALIKSWIGIPLKIAFPVKRTKASIVLPAIFITLGASVLGIFASSAIANIMERLFHLTPMANQFPHPVGKAATVIYLIYLSFAPAILEELMFRGVIMQSLRRFGDVFALICSSILFSLAHHNLVQGPNAFILGMVIGFFAMRTGSLLTGIILHFVNNTLSVVAFLSTKNLSPAEINIFNTLLIAFYAISGLVCIISLVAKKSEILYLAPSQYPLTEGKKYSLFFANTVPVIYILFVVIITCRQFVPPQWY